MDIPRHVKNIINGLNKSGFKAYCVGGCVRDSLLLKTPHDWDITTDAEPSEIKEALSDMKTVDTGIKHGTVTVICKGQKAEVTTFRRDGAYPDHRHPDKVAFSGELKDDLARRDFTINAMAYDEKNGVTDLFGGKEDIEKGLIRTVGDPEERFSEDGLRILRALRFSSVLGFSVEEKTKDAAIKCKGLLKYVSGERVYEEMTKLMLGNSALPVLLAFPDVIAEAIPEAAPLIGFDQRSKYHKYDLWEHTSRAIAAVSCEETLKWAMLFHDIGKPDTFTFDGENGHFYGHAQISAEKTRKRLSAFGVSNEKKDRICRLVRYHDSDLFATEKSIKRWLSRIGEEELLMLLSVKRADNAAQSGEFDRSAQYAESEKLIREVAAKKPCVSEKLLDIDGNDLKALGARGAEIGRIKKALIDAVIEEKCENKREALLKYASAVLRKTLICDKIDNG